MIGRAIIAKQRRFPVILELRILRVPIIPNERMRYSGVHGAAERKELLHLVAADVAQDAAGFLLLKKPRRAG